MKAKSIFFNKDKIASYFLGFLLLPWIVLWGFWLIISLFLFFFEINSQKEVVQFLAFDYFSETINLLNLWGFTSVSLVLNYTLAFILTKEYPKISFFFLILSFINLFFLTMLLWPHIVILLGR